MVFFFQNSQTVLGNLKLTWLIFYEKLVIETLYMDWGWHVRVHCIWTITLPFPIELSALFILWLGYWQCQTATSCCFCFWLYHFVSKFLKTFRKAEDFVPTLLHCLESSNPDIVTSALTNLAEFTLLCQGMSCSQLLG